MERYRILIDFDPDDKPRLKRLAKSEGLSVTSYVRRLVTIHLRTPTPPPVERGEES